MGPHSFKCGSLGGMGVIRIAEGGFNGAALFQVRKSDQSNPQSRSSRLASMGPHSFKCGSNTNMKISVNTLRASMGPHSFKCGSPHRRPLSQATPTCFNGAALFQVRKLGGGWVRAASSAAASMGPHSFKCGSSGAVSLKLLGNLASMGPHSFKCGS